MPQNLKKNCSYITSTIFAFLCVWIIVTSRYVLPTVATSIVVAAVVLKLWLFWFPQAKTVFWKKCFAYYFAIWDKNVASQMNNRMSSYYQMRFLQWQFHANLYCWGKNLPVKIHHTLTSGWCDILAFSLKTIRGQSYKNLHLKANFKN